MAALNQRRLSVAQIDPTTCQHSEEHSAGLALTHSFAAALTRHGAGGRAESIQAACRFELLPFKPPPEGECADGRHDGSCETQPCFGAEYRTMMTGCAATCGVCKPCEDKNAECSSWASDWQCLTNAHYMTQECPQACGVCGIMFDPQPPLFVALWNGLLMPTVGFGTAGLGNDGGDAVEMAIHAGITMVDSAQAREWYREDLSGQVRIVLACALAGSVILELCAWGRCRLRPAVSLPPDTAFCDSAASCQVAVSLILVMSWMLCGLLP